MIRFRRLSERWFTEFPWPEAERIAQFVNNGEVMLICIDTNNYNNVCVDGMLSGSSEYWHLHVHATLHIQTVFFFVAAIKRLCEPINGK